MTVPLLIARDSAGLPTRDAARPALALGARSPVGYGRLDRRSRAWARQLALLGVGAGDRVGLLLRNSVEYIVGYFAITRMSAIAVRFNWRVAPAELSVLLADSECTVVLVHESLAGQLRAALEAVPPDAIPRVVEIADPAESDSGEVEAGELDGVSGGASGLGFAEPSPGDDAMIMYTSGTTGTPKGAIWTHANTVSFAMMQAIAFGFGPDTVAMTLGPLYHAGAFEDLLHPAMLVGGLAVCMPSGSLRIHTVAEVIERHRVTDVLLYPFMLDSLLDEEILAGSDLSSLRRIVSGGDPVPEGTLERAARWLPNIEVVQAYGLTEGGGMTSFLPGAEARAHPGSVGHPLPLTEVRIKGDDGRLLPWGQDGEVLTRSPSVARGYWRRPEATAETFRDGWCHTGDVGRIEEGRLRITGRKKDMIRSGGENIYAAEVEKVVNALPGVAEAVAVSVPDAQFVEAVCVVAVADGEQPGRDEVIAHCRERLGGYKVPRHVVFTAELPRSPSGKVLRARLRDEYRHLGDSSLRTGTEVNEA